MSNTERPLSPHLSIYRWPVTMVSSILHRATGVALSLGFIVLVAWLFDAASGPESYAVLAAVLGSPLGMLFFAGLSFSFFYHLGNGVRHLVWDTGRGFEKSQANVSAWFVIVLAVVLTAIFWWMVL